MTKVSFAKDNHVVKTIPSDRTDEPLRASVLPWGPRRDWPVAYAHRPNAPNESLAISRIPVANKISRRFLPPVGFGQLLCNPLGIRMCCHAQPQGRLGLANAHSPDRHEIVRKTPLDYRAAFLSSARSSAASGSPGAPIGEVAGDDDGVGPRIQPHDMKIGDLCEQHGQQRWHNRPSEETVWTTSLASTSERRARRRCSAARAAASLRHQAKL
jgi:hypothetical protein